MNGLGIAQDIRDFFGVGSTDSAVVQVKTRDWPRLGGNRKPETVSGAAQLQEAGAPLA
jgi:hypothetical protein